MLRDQVGFTVTRRLFQSGTTALRCASAREYTPSDASEDCVRIDIREDFTVAVAAELLK
jgi:hypothetical protein